MQMVKGFANKYFAYFFTKPCLVGTINVLKFHTLACLIQWHMQKVQTQMKLLLKEFAFPPSILWNKCLKINEYPQIMFSWRNEKNCTEAFIIILLSNGYALNNVVKCQIIISFRSVSLLIINFLWANSPDNKFSFSLGGWVRCAYLKGPKLQQLTSLSLMSILVFVSSALSLAFSFIVLGFSFSSHLLAFHFPSPFLWEMTQNDTQGLMCHSA